MAAVDFIYQPLNQPDIVFVVSSNLCAICDEVHTAICDILKTDRNINISTVDGFLGGQSIENEFIRHTSAAKVVVAPVCEHFFQKYGLYVGDDIKGKYLFVESANNHSQLPQRWSKQNLVTLKWYNTDSSSIFMQSVKTLLVKTEDGGNKTDNVTSRSQENDNKHGIVKGAPERKESYSRCNEHSSAMISNEFIEQNTAAIKTMHIDLRTCIQRINQRDHMAKTYLFNKIIPDCIEAERLLEIAQCVCQCSLNSVVKLCLNHLWSLFNQGDVSLRSFTSQLPHVIGFLLDAYMKDNTIIYSDLECRNSVLLLLGSMLAVVFYLSAQNGENGQQLLSLVKISIFKEQANIITYLQDRLQKKIKETSSKVLTKIILIFLRLLDEFKGLCSQDVRAEEVKNVCEKNTYEKKVSQNIISIIMCLQVLRSKITHVHKYSGKSPEKTFSDKQLTQNLFKILEMECSPKEIKESFINRSEAKSLFICYGFSVLTYFMKQNGENVEWRNTRIVEIMQLLGKKIDAEMREFVFNHLVSECILLPHLDIIPLRNVVFGVDGVTEPKEIELYKNYFMSNYQKHILEKIDVTSRSKTSFQFKALIGGKPCFGKCAIDLLKFNLRSENHDSYWNVMKDKPVVLLAVNEIDKLRKLGRNSFIAMKYGFVSTTSDQPLPIYLLREHSGRNLTLYRFLRERCQRKDRVDLDQMLSFFLDISNAVLYCHSKGVVVRNIAPSSFHLFGSEDNGYSLKLMDLESSIYLSEDINDDSRKMSEIEKCKLIPEGYYAPETISAYNLSNKRLFNEATDVYAIGCCMHSCFEYGKPPFVLTGKTVNETAMLKVGGLKLKQTPGIPTECFYTIVEATACPERRITLEKCKEKLEAYTCPKKDSHLDSNPPLPKRPQDSKEDSDQPVLYSGIPKIDEKFYGKFYDSASSSWFQFSPRKIEINLEAAEDEPEYRHNLYEDKLSLHVTESGDSNNRDMMRLLKIWEREYKNLHPFDTHGLVIYHDKQSRSIKTTLLENAKDLLSFCKEVKSLDSILDILAQLARIVHYGFHQHGYIVNDLKAKYIWITTCNKVVICRYARVVELPECYYDQTTDSRSITLQEVPEDIIRWSGSETIDDRIRCTGSDKYAYGVIIWECMQVFSRMSSKPTPWGSFELNEISDQLLTRNTLSQPSNCELWLYQIMKKLWQQHYVFRPHLLDVAEVFESSSPQTHLMLHNHLSAQETPVYYKANHESSCEDKSSAMLKATEDDMENGYYSKDSRQIVSNHAKIPRVFSIYESKVQKMQDSSESYRINNPNPYEEPASKRGDLFFQKSAFGHYYNTTFVQKDSPYSYAIGNRNILDGTRPRTITVRDSEYENVSVKVLKKKKKKSRKPWRKNGQKTCVDLDYIGDLSNDETEYTSILRNGNINILDGSRPKTKTVSTPVRDSEYEPIFYAPDILSRKKKKKWRMEKKWSKDKM